METRPSVAVSSGPRGGVELTFEYPTDSTAGRYWTVLSPENALELAIRLTDEARRAIVAYRELMEAK